MNWIENSPTDYSDQKQLLKRLNKLTLYNHNYTSKIDMENLTLSCVFNCKKMNRQYSIIGKIEGDLLTRNIQISCSLVDFCRIVIGKWQHQKIQLTKFASKYNQKSSNIGKTAEEAESYQIKVNPFSGEFYVCYHFLITSELIKDGDKFRLKMTDQCQKLGTEAQKIFNTILQLIFFQQANDPYLKSDQRIGMHYSRPVKVTKLLKKVKKLNMISSAYKIKQDITGVSKLRSFFKKVYLHKTQKTVSNPLIIENAVVFIPKFSKKNLDSIVQSTSQSKKTNTILTPFQELEDNHEIQFARHLEQNLLIEKIKPLINLHDLNANQLQKLVKQPGKYTIQRMSFSLNIISQGVSSQLLRHQHRMLEKLGLKGFKHPVMIQYYYTQEQPQNIRITESFDCLSLKDYLERSAKTISLSTRLQIMAQICHLIEFLHKNNIGYFLNFDSIYITEDNTVKIKDFSSAYSVAEWDEARKEKMGANDKSFIMPNVEEFRLVVGYRGDEPGSKDMCKDQPIQKKLENQKADVFCLGMILYRILMNKFPFSPNSINMLYNMGQSRVEEYLMQIWTLQTQFFLRQGGMIAKLLAQLLLKCFHLDCSKRPFVEWITVIICEIKSSLEGLY